jgi:hypothetical protein
MNLGGEYIRKIAGSAFASRELLNSGVAVESSEVEGLRMCLQTARELTQATIGSRTWLYAVRAPSLFGLDQVIRFGTTVLTTRTDRVPELGLEPEFTNLTRGSKRVAKPANKLLQSCVQDLYRCWLQLTLMIAWVNLAYVLMRSIVLGQNVKWLRKFVQAR